MKTLILNRSSIVQGTKNTVYKYKFQSTVTFRKARIALAKLSMYYSWPNITTMYNNTSFSYQWFDTSGNLTKTYSVDIPDGYYTLGDLNLYLYEVLVSRGHYVTYSPTATTILGTSNGIAHSGSTKYVFFQIQENATFYSAQLSVYGVPPYGTLYASYGAVNGFGWRPPTTSDASIYYTGKFIIPSSNLFSKVIGFNSGVVGTGQVNRLTTQEDILSDFTPELCPVASVLMTCSLCKNKYSSPSSLVYSFTATTDYGAMIDEIAYQYMWTDIQPGSYNEFTIEFRDQDFRQMAILDPNNVIMLVLDEIDDEK